VALGLSGPPNGVSWANESTADGSCWVRSLVELGAFCASSSVTMLRSAVARTRSAGALAVLAETVAPLLRAMRAPLLFGASSCGRTRRTMADLRWERRGTPSRRNDSRRKKRRPPPSWRSTGGSLLRKHAGENAGNSRAMHVPFSFPGSCRSLRQPAQSTG
jgi:hypothetical protein